MPINITSLGWDGTRVWDSQFTRRHGHCQLLSNLSYIKRDVQMDVWFPMIIVNYPNCFFLTKRLKRDYSWCTLQSSCFKFDQKQKYFVFSSWQWQCLDIEPGNMSNFIREPRGSFFNFRPILVRQKFSRFTIIEYNFIPHLNFGLSDNNYYQTFHSLWTANSAT